MSTQPEQQGDQARGVILACVHGFYIFIPNAALTP